MEANSNTLPANIPLLTDNNNIPAGNGAACDGAAPPPVEGGGNHVHSVDLWNEKLCNFKEPTGGYRGCRGLN